MRRAIYPGSFDPVTNGHLNIIERAAKNFDELIVCVMINAEKHPVFTSSERVELIRRVTKHLPNVAVMQSNQLLAEFAREQNCGVVIKGLRALSDFEHEFQMALINHKLNPGLDTMFLTTEHQFMYLSSSIVKEMAYYGADLHGFVPDAIIDDKPHGGEEQRRTITWRTVLKRPSPHCMRWCRMRGVCRWAQRSAS